MVGSLARGREETRRSCHPTRTAKSLRQTDIQRPQEPEIKLPLEVIEANRERNRIDVSRERAKRLTFIETWVTVESSSEDFPTTMLSAFD